jgi:hypothetical protein
MDRSVEIDALALVKKIVNENRNSCPWTCDRGPVRPQVPVFLLGLVWTAVNKGQDRPSENRPSTRPGLRPKARRRTPLSPVPVQAWRRSRRTPWRAFCRDIHSNKTYAFNPALFIFKFLYHIQPYISLQIVFLKNGLNLR